MRKLVLAVVVGGVIFTAVYGLAASLNVSSNTLGAGSATVAACQSGTVNVSYTPAYSSSQPGYQATTVTVGNIDTASSACGGKTLSATVVDGSNTSLGSGSTTITSGGASSVSFTVSGVSAASVGAVHVAITG